MFYQSVKVICLLFVPLCTLVIAVVALLSRNEAKQNKIKLNELFSFILV